MEARNLSFDMVNIGDGVAFEHSFNEADVEQFAGLSGDYNPLHMDNSYATTTQFKRRVVHGMLVGSLCSQLVGMYLPGKKCLYLKQSLSFKQPVYIRDGLKVIGVVTSKSEATAVLFISIRIEKEKEVVIEGEAVVQVLS